jgi:hypothetical protein
VTESPAADAAGDVLTAGALSTAADELLALVHALAEGQYDLNAAPATVESIAGARLAAFHNQRRKAGATDGYITADHGTAADPQWHPDWSAMQAAWPRLHQARVIFPVQSSRISAADAQDRVERAARAWTGRAAVRAEVANLRAEILGAAARAIFTAAVDAHVEFAGWLAAALADVARGYPGHADRVLTERPGSWEAAHVRGLITGTLGPD